MEFLVYPSSYKNYCKRTVQFRGIIFHYILQQIVMTKLTQFLYRYFVTNLISACIIFTHSVALKCFADFEYI